MSNTVSEAKAKLAEIGRLLFARRLTDAAGGNISMLADDGLVCMSPTRSGSDRQWQLNPDDILLVNRQQQILEGAGGLSRETSVHFSLYDAFDSVGTAVIHAHPRNIMPFAAMAMPMPPVLEANLKFGEVKCIPYAPAHSVKLAEYVVDALRGQEARISNHAAGVIAPWHGIFLIAKNIDAAFDAVERFDTNARSILMAGALGGENLLLKQRTALLEAATQFGKQF